MKICWFGFAASNHSWAIVAQSICRELKNLGHDVDIFSTNGNLYFPQDLKENLKGFIEPGKNYTQNDYISLISKLDKNYDMQLSYTVFFHFANYFSRGSKNRFGIWNYETTVIPKGFAKYCGAIDQVLPSSEFSRKIFLDNGIKDDKMTVIPHGVDLKRFENKNKYKINSNKKYKILANIAQPHFRKNLPGLLEAYAKAFTRKDDVCLVLKISKKSPQNIIGKEPVIMDINVDSLLLDLKKKYKDLGEIKIIDEFIPDIVELYNACDIVFTMSLAECFYMPGLEALAANKIVVAPRYGGQLDFLNDKNSMLIDGKIIRADTKMQYWEPSVYAKAFMPSIDDAANKLKEVVNNYDDYLTTFSPFIKEKTNEFTWTNAVNKILKLSK